MGIKGLLAKLRELDKKRTILRKVKLHDLRDRVIAFDASLYIYKWSLAAGGTIKNKDGKPINHLQGALSSAMCMRRAGITPCYVFDGKPPVEKAATISDRNKRREDGAKTPPKLAWEETKSLFAQLGVTTLTADGEADPYLAALTMNDVAYAVATADLDLLAFGAKRVIIDIDCSRGNATMIVLEDVLAALEMTQTQFIDYCILLGSDYTAKTLPRIGPARSFAMINKYRTIEKLLDEEKIQSPAEFTFIAARAVFLATPPEVPVEITDKTTSASIKEWLANAGLAGKRIDNLFAQ